MLLHVCVVLLGTVGVQAQVNALQWDEIEQPLRVCTASIQDFGARCNGAPHPSLEDEVQPMGPVPPRGWCIEGDFCGYDVSVFRAIASDINLQEGKHYVPVCMGERGFGVMIDDLAGKNRTLGKCDLAASTITASSEREEMGISFSRATHRSALAIMTYAPLKQRGKWAFFEPLHKDVWIALAMTILVTPIFVFFFETIFSGRSMYSDHHGHLSILHGLKEALWHSISHTLSIDVFKVNAFPSRLVTVAYGFLVMILTNTYTANLAAFLTVAQLDTTINSVSDLRGKAVATVQPYVKRLYDNHQLSATDVDDWDYEQMIRKLKTGQYKAVISDDVQIIPEAYQDESCSLHVLDELIEPFDLAIAYRKGFPYGRLKTEISNSLLRLQEAGTLASIKDDYVPPQPSCLESTEFSETNRVHVRALWGLWIILASAVGLATVGALVHFFIVKRKNPEEQRMITARARPFRDSLQSMVSVPSVPSIVEAFQSAGLARRTRDNNSESVKPSSPPPSASGRALWGNANSKLSASMRSSRVRNDSAVEALAVVTEGIEETAAVHPLGAGGGGTSNLQIKSGNESPLTRPEGSPVAATTSPLTMSAPQAVPAESAGGAPTRCAQGPPAPVTPASPGATERAADALGAAEGETTRARGPSSGSGGDTPPGCAPPVNGGASIHNMVASMRSNRRDAQSSAATQEINDILLPCMPPNMGRPGNVPLSASRSLDDAVQPELAGAPAQALAADHPELDLHSELASLSDLVRLVDDKVSRLITDAQCEQSGSDSQDE